jgi:hypothetical protein
VWIAPADAYLAFQFGGRAVLYPRDFGKVTAGAENFCPRRRFYYTCLFRRCTARTDFKENLSTIRMTAFSTM